MKILKAPGVFLLFVALACDANVSARGELETPERWHLTEDSRIGSLDDPDQSLSLVEQVIIGSDHEFYVPDPAELVIRVYSANGALLRKIGRSGQGPGEFQRIHSVGLRQDTLYVSDFGSGRVNLFSLDGRFLSSKSMVTERFGHPDVTLYWPTPPSVLLNDGSGIVRPSHSIRFVAASDPGVHTLEYRVLYLRLDGNSGYSDTIAWIPRQSSVLNVMRGGTMHRLHPPFPEYSLAEIMPDGSGVVIVDRAPSSGGDVHFFRIVLINPAGDTVFVRRMSYEPVSVTSAHVRSALENMPRIQRPSGGGPFGDPLTHTEAESALRQSSLIPSTLPPVTQLVAGQDGSIYTRREETHPDSVIWNVLSPQGYPDGWFRLPNRRTVIAAKAGVVAALEHDEFDVPHIIRYRVLR